MLERYFAHRFHLERFRSGPFAPYLDSLSELLQAAGYATRTAREYLGSAAHLGVWMARSKLPIRSLDEAMIVRFGKHLRSCRCPPPVGVRSGYGACRAAEIALGHLRELGVVERATEPPPVPDLVQSFEHWMRQHRGVCDATLSMYRPVLLRFLRAEGQVPEEYAASGIRRFVVRRARGASAMKVGSTIAAMKMFLRYLAAAGECRPGLDAAIPKLARWSLASLPRGLPPADVDRLLSACDVRTPFGRRDRAILLLLARLGLRAGDVLELRLGDIDFAEATLRVRGKGRRETLLPLPQEVGDAILAYLERDRPRGHDDERVFFKVLAPRTVLSGNAVSQIVTRAIRRAGVATRRRGAHVLRHSAATEMLRQGASVESIARVLRHRFVQTTIGHYAKVDIELLRQVSQPWPQGAPC